MTNLKCDTDYLTLKKNILVHYFHAKMSSLKFSSNHPEQAWVSSD